MSAAERERGATSNAPPLAFCGWGALREETKRLHGRLLALL